MPRTVTFDGPAKRIILSTAGMSSAYVWSAWTEWQSLNPRWAMALEQTGVEALGAGRFTPAYFFLVNGWMIRPMESDHNLMWDGNMAIKGGGNPFVRTLGQYQVNTNLVVPVQAQAIAVAGGISTGPSAAEIAAAVRAELYIELSRINVAVSTRASTGDVFAAT
jgi:hypothetical protein